MKLFFCTFALLFSVVAALDLICSGQMNTSNNEYTFYFSANRSTVEFMVSAYLPTNAWVGVGVSENRVMPMTDVVIGAINGNDSFINDRYATARARPPVDEQQDITNTMVKREGNVTTMKFTRPRVSTDPNGVDINLDQCRNILWAYGGAVPNFNDPTTIGPHSQRGVFPNQICVPERCYDGVLICEALDPPDNGMVNDGNRQYQTIANYTCNTGFLLDGNAMRTCQDDGTWSGSDPTCIDLSQVDCGPLNNPENGNVTLTAMGYGVTGFNATATYMCNEGFDLEGNAMRTCEIGNMWSGSDPTCGAIVAHSSILVTAILALIGTMAVFKF